MSQIVVLLTKYPLLRGVVSYSIIWPTSALIQQKIAGESWGKLKHPADIFIKWKILLCENEAFFFFKTKKDNIDWMKCVRFSVYGGLYVAPTLYTWIRVSSKLFPKNNLRSAVSKVLYYPHLMECSLANFFLVNIASPKLAIVYLFGQN